jgi:uncharacterized cupin superfamily protein
VTTYLRERAGLNLLDATLEQHDYASVSVRETLGGEKIGCTLYEIEDGRQLWPYHLHWNNEEWLLVVEGTPRLRTPEGERDLRAGDLVAFPEGEAGAHALVGPGRVAIFSTRNQGSVVYPDSGKVGAGPPWDRLYFRRADAVDYWEGE